MNKKNTHKKPPQNIKAERSLLGSLLIDGEAINKVAHYLSENDFYHPRHQKIYRAILNLFQESSPIDILSLSNKLQEKKELKKIGGRSYLAELTNSVPTASNVESYAKIVQKKRILRDLLQASHRIEGLAFQEDKNSDVLLDKAEQHIFKIAQKSLHQRFRPLSEGLEETFDRIDKLSKHEEGLRGIPTGFRKVDDMLAGLQKSDIIILAARPSMGKSALALNIARNVAVFENIPVGIFSLEMSEDQIIDRFISSQADINLWKLRTGRLSEKGEVNDFTKVQEALGTLSEAPLFIDDVHATNVLQMRAMARRLKSQHGLGLLIIDYLQLMQPLDSSVGIVQQVTQNSKSLKSLAKELNVPILVLSQLSRAVEKRTPHIPRLSDLRESGSIEQDADVVMFIYREDFYKEDTPRENIADLIIGKHRNGPIGRVELFFDKPKTTFRNLEKEN